MHVIQCKYCNHTYVGGSQWIRVHLLGLRVNQYVYNIDPSQSNPTLRWFTIHIWLNQSRMRMHVWYVWFILCIHMYVYSFIHSFIHSFTKQERKATFPLRKKVYFCLSINVCVCVVWCHVVSHGDAKLNQLHPKFPRNFIVDRSPSLTPSLTTSRVLQLLGDFWLLSVHEILELWD